MTCWLPKQLTITSTNVRPPVTRTTTTKLECIGQMILHGQCWYQTRATEYLNHDELNTLLNLFLYKKHRVLINIQHWKCSLPEWIVCPAGCCLGLFRQDVAAIQTDVQTMQSFPWHKVTYNHPIFAIGHDTDKVWEKVIYLWTPHSPSPTPPFHPQPLLWWGHFFMHGFHLLSPHRLLQVLLLCPLRFSGRKPHSTCPPDHTLSWGKPLLGEVVLLISIHERMPSILSEPHIVVFCVQTETTYTSHQQWQPMRQQIGILHTTFWALWKLISRRNHFIL